MNDPVDPVETIDPIQVITQELDRRDRQLKSKGRWMTGLVVVLLLACGALSHEWQVQSTGSHAKDKAIASLQGSMSALQKKSSEQTVAEVQLRDDVNTLTATNKTFTANHTESVDLFCSILAAVHDSSSAYRTYCPAIVP